jgi:DNA-binding NtrC family response regulator
LARNLHLYQWSLKPLARILIVDDDKLIRWSLRELLSQEGHQVETLASAEAALGKVQSELFDLVIADLEINDQDGVEMLKKIRNVQPGAKMIVLSAHSRNKVESLLEDFPVGSIVEKPFRGEEIKAIAKRVLDSAN